MRTQKTDMNKLEKFLKSNKFDYEVGINNETDRQLQLVVKFNEKGTINKYKKPKEKKEKPNET